MTTGLEIVIKNQNGELSDFEDSINNILLFDCAICGKNKPVKINCKQSKRTFKTIRYHLHTQLICGVCQTDIWMLNNLYNHRKQNGLTLDSIYERVGMHLYNHKKMQQFVIM